MLTLKQSPVSRPLTPAVLLGLLVSVVACQKAPSHLGGTCKVNADCVSGQCTSSVCTRSCANQGDCPVGFDCRVASDKFPGAGSSLLCIQQSYASPDGGGFGTECTTVAGGCTDGGMSPCAEGFSCHAYQGVKCDPTAYCTTTGCKSDLDCPPDMMCGEEQWVNQTTGKQESFQGCLKRDRCDPCETNDECPSGFICAQDNLGGRFCGQPCQTDDDCLKPFKTQNSTGQTMQYGSFETCQTNPAGTACPQNGKGCVCAPGTGACHGKSAISSISGNGQICSPCRPGFDQPDGGDCGKGLGCFQEYDGERFCTQGCQMTITFNASGTSYNQSADPCPSNSYCFYGGVAALGDLCAVPEPDGGYTLKSPCQVNGVCNADSDYQADTCYPQ